MSQLSAQSKWKTGNNRSQRRSNRQSMSSTGRDNDDPKLIDHYKDTRNGDIWGSPYDGPNFRRGKGHDKKKAWRD